MIELRVCVMIGREINHLIDQLMIDEDAIN